jgi:uncharacterized membrane protein
MEHTAYGRNSLSARMHVYREVWIRRMLDREARTVDMQIMASLQNGTAYAAGQTARYTGSRSPCHPNDKNVEAAGRHFNRGQRAFFFALGYLGWFVSPWVLFATTAAVVIVTWRRQFASNAWRATESWF